MRAISSPDDYFSLMLLTVWFLFGVLAAPNDVAGGEGVLLTFFLLTAFFLVYVPFSKISHYLYYPFTRYYLGRTLGHRGVFPMRRA
jgi:nitrate reductase gamma subunit